RLAAFAGPPGTVTLPLAVNCTEPGKSHGCMIEPSGGGRCASGGGGGASTGASTGASNPASVGASASCPPSTGGGLTPEVLSLEQPTNNAAAKKGRTARRMIRP